MLWKKLLCIFLLLSIVCMLCSCFFLYPILFVWKVAPDEVEAMPDIDIEVIDCSYDFVNGEQLPEDPNADHTHYPMIEETDFTRIFYGTGTSDTLEGNLVVVLFFMDDEESKWDEAAVENFTRISVLPALDFIRTQASEWAVELDFEVWRYSAVLSEGVNCFYDGIVNPDLSNGGSTKDVMDKAAWSLGYSYNMALRQALLEKSEEADIIPIFVLNKSGISYARNCYTANEIDYCEQAIIFSNGSNGKTDRGATFAHELLHLFGAEELYSPDGRYELAVSLYPRDIMCLETRDLKILQINDFTAYAIGWHDNTPEICNHEQWYRGYSIYDKYLISEEES